MSFFIENYVGHFINFKDYDFNFQIQIDNLFDPSKMDENHLNRLDFTWLSLYIHYLFINSPKCMFGSPFYDAFFNGSMLGNPLVYIYYDLVIY